MSATAFWPNIAEVLEVEGAHSIYISGPMTYIPQGNAPAFDRCASALRAVDPGVLVMSPAEMDRARGFDIDGWDGHSATDTDINVILAEDIGIVCQVDLLVLLPGWENSGGGTLEIAVAARLGKPLYLWHEDTATLEPLELSSIIAVCQQSGHTGSKLYGRIA
jgi:hypothetical protein